MTLAEARQKLKPPLFFGNIDQIQAVDFIGRVQECVDAIKVSADAVRAWAHLHRNNSGSDRVYELAMQHADLMEDWQRTIKSKKADVPEGV